MQEKKGIELDFTVPYTPQLNGKAERLNRALMKRARAFKFDSNEEGNVGRSYIYTAIFLLNRSPTNATECTPIEM